jgi:autophagy-related protein 2
MAAQNKSDIRIGGFVLDLIGSECSIGLETSALKVVTRDTGIGASISKIRLSGPHLKRSNEEPAINLEVTGTRLEYLLSPRDSDLERLLNIITPSKSKYDQADDILLDTLVRQRKQGPVLNVNVEAVQARIEKLEELSYLPDLGEEVAKLATVAKYLPEAERPGMLGLLKVQKFDAHVDVNETLGSLQLSAGDVDLAQITLPILVATGVGTISIHRNNTEELLGPASNAASRDPQARAPALMARMIGDELEPTIKLKLWNLKLEYRVPTLMILLGLAESDRCWTSQSTSNALCECIR